MKRLLFVAVIAIVVIGGIAWWVERDKAGDALFALYGNVEQREVSLAFNSSERVTAVLVEEGERVREGQVLARLDTSRLEPRVVQAEAEVAAQQAAVDRLRNGSRPEEIEQARANVSSARADALNARQQYERQTALLQSNLTSRQDVDRTKALVDAAEARVQSAQKALDLLVGGSRQEDILQGEALLDGKGAQLQLLQRELEEATLVAPVEGIVRARLLEPGEMASPQKPVVSVLIMQPKWIRAYVTEERLGLIKPGLGAEIEVDAFPGRRFPGRVGYISSVAEFTPKNVQTEDLRTSLVYQVRIVVNDPEDELRLGMPATVHILSSERPVQADEGVSSSIISPERAASPGSRS